jgi:signal transduction histidine kinase
MLVVCWIWCGVLQAQPIVTLDAAADGVSLDGRMEWLEDPDAGLTEQEAASAPGWRPLAGLPNAGFTRSAIWLRLKLLQPDGSTAWRLQVDNTLIEHVHLYQRDADGQWRSWQAGRALRHSQWPLQTRSSVFRLDLPAGPHEFMLRLATRNSLSTSVHLWKAETFYAHAQGEALLWGVYFGLYFLVILIQFLFWKWTREALSGWYVLYAGLNCLSMLMTMGYLQNMLDWDADLMVPLLGLSICASLYAGTQFTVVVLELGRHMPRLDRLLVRGSACLAVATATLVLAGRYGLGVSIAQIASMGWIVVVSWATLVLLLRRREATERFLLLAFGVFFVGILIRYLRNLGWLQPGLLTDNSIQFGSVLHMIMMCVFIVHRYNALQSALRIEQAARQEQRDFVALVSHEFRTPLAIIDTSAQQLSTHLDAPAEKSLKRCANIQAAARRMTDLMDRYLTAERLDQSLQALQMQPCDLGSLLAGLVTEWPEGRVHLSAEQLPTDFCCDADLLRLALRNLIGNADRHAAPGTTIELALRQPQRGSLELRVTNIGDTIAADELPLLFQKFYRGRAVRGKPGAGLGLFLVQQVVDAHGGHIQAQSAAGTTSFRIWLPGAPPPQASARTRGRRGLQPD